MVDFEPCVICFFDGDCNFAILAYFGEEGLHSGCISCGKDHVVGYVLLLCEGLRV